MNNTPDDNFDISFALSNRAEALAFTDRLERAVPKMRAALMVLDLDAMREAMDEIGEVAALLDNYTGGFTDDHEAYEKAAEFLKSGE